MQEQEKQIFQGYEIKNWNFTPRLYKILAAASVFNLVTILVLGQTSLLTKKGCESPLVNRVCQVIDTLYVGSVLFNTDGEFVSKDYEKTELEDADITFVDVSGQEEPLRYPEGYFALANPEGFQAVQPTDFSAMPLDMNGFPTNSTITNPMDLMTTPQVTPTPNNNAIVGSIPDKPFDFGPNPTITKRGKIPKVYTPKPLKFPKVKNGSPTKLPSDEELAKNEEKEKEKKNEKQPDKSQKPVESESVSEVEINKKPFEDLGDSLLAKIEKKEVDLNKPFSVVLDGTISADGKLDSKKSKFIKFDGDKQMVDVAKEAIEAVGNSGFLGYLKNYGIDKVNITLVQDDKQIYAIIVSDQKTPEKAGTTASGFNSLLSGIKLLDQNGLKKLDERSKALVNNSKVTSQGNNFVFNFTLSKPVAQDIINQSLKERAEKKAAQQPNSTAQNENENLKTAK
jgi:hypothetical protein